MLQRFRAKLFQLVKIREYLGARVVSLNSELLTLVKEISNALHPAAKVVFKPLCSVVTFFIGL